MRIPILLLALPLLAQDARKCAVEGTVVNASTGQPLRQVEVGVVPVVERRPGVPTPHAIGVYTNSDGHFRIDELNPGTYRIVIQKLGFTVSREPNAAYVLPRLEPGRELRDLQFRLYPQSVITGRVVDDNGDPVSGANVYLVRRSPRPQPAAGASTNDQGLFHLANVDPGNYRLLAQHTESREIIYPLPGGALSAYVPTYAPGVSDPEQAQILQVEEGAVQTGIEVRLRREAVYSIRGRALDMEDRPMGRFHVIANSPDNSYGISNTSSRTLPDGSFEIRGLRPGTINLTAFPTDGRNPSQAALATVQLGNADLEGVTLQVQPPVRISGVATLEGAGNVQPQWNQVALYASATGIRPTAGGRLPQLDSDGTFTLELRGRGVMRLNVAGVPAPDTYLEAILAGSENIAGRPLDLSSGGPGPLRIIFRTGAARISGRIDAAGPTTFISRQFVHIWPADPNARTGPLSSASAQPDGSFQFDNLRPGDYLVYQPSEDDLYAPSPPADLESRATRVRLEPGSNQQVILKAPAKGGRR